MKLWFCSVARFLTVFALCDRLYNVVLRGRTYLLEVQSASSPPKLMPVKPKVYLLARLTIPAGSCVDLSAAEAA